MLHYNAALFYLYLLTCPSPSPKLLSPDVSNFDLRWGWNMLWAGARLTVDHRLVRKERGEKEDWSCDWELERRQNRRRMIFTSIILSQLEEAIHYWATTELGAMREIVWSFDKFEVITSCAGSRLSVNIGNTWNNGTDLTRDILTAAQRTEYHSCRAEDFLIARLWYSFLLTSARHLVIVISGNVTTPLVLVPWEAKEDHPSIVIPDMRMGQITFSSFSLDFWVWYSGEEWIMVNK